MKVHSTMQLLRNLLPLLFLSAGFLLAGCNKDENITPASREDENGLQVLTSPVNGSIPIYSATKCIPPGEWYFCLKPEDENDSLKPEYFIPGLAGEKKDGTYLHLLLPENTPCVKYTVMYVSSKDQSDHYDLGFSIEIDQEGNIKCTDYFDEQVELFGKGTKDWPYKISSLDDIIRVEVMTQESGLDNVYFLQINDIYCDEIPNKYRNNKDGGINPIGSIHSFEGNYDGGGHVIDKIKIIATGTTNKLGLFGSISKNASLRNITMQATSIQNAEQYVGSLVAIMTDNSSIVNCKSKSVNVSGTEHVGGIVGCMKGGSIINCHNTDNGSVRNNNHNNPHTQYIGGIIGSISPANGATIRIDSLSCFSDVEGHENVGGIIGFMGNNGSPITIANLRIGQNSIIGERSVGGLIGGCTASLTLRNSACNAVIRSKGSDKRDYGGLIGAVGSNGSLMIDSCKLGYNDKGEQADPGRKCIEAERNTGGLVGYIQANGGTTIMNCDQALKIEGSQYVGGLVGQAVTPLTITNCKADRADIKATISHAGGFVGAAAAKITLSGNNQNQSYVTSDGNYAGGFVGEAKDEIIIKKAINAGYITANGKFAGGYVGYANKLTVEDLNTSTSAAIIVGQEYQGGVAGYATSGTIKQVSLGFHIGGPGSTCINSGGIIGFLANGTIEGCTFSGSVQGGQYTGGIVGRQNGGDINNCKTDNSKNKILCNAEGKVGGIVGYMTTVGIDNCENNIQVENSQKAPDTGGIVGYIDTQRDNKRIVNCINNATVIGGDQTGGILGGTCSSSKNNTQIGKCHNYGEITGQDETGGISGSFAQGQMIFCSNHGNVMATKRSAGGIAGCLYGNENFHAGGLVSQCYNIGTVNGPENVGGIVGKIFDWSYGKIHNSYNRAQVGHDGSSYCAGIVGHPAGNAYSEIKYCYSGGKARTGWGIMGVEPENHSWTSSWSLTRCHYSSESAPSDKSDFPDYTSNTNGGLSDQKNFHDWDFSGTWVMKVQPELRNNRETTK